MLQTTILLRPTPLHVFGRQGIDKGYSTVVAEPKAEYVAAIREWHKEPHSEPPARLMLRVSGLGREDGLYAVTRWNPIVEEVCVRKARKVDLCVPDRGANATYYVDLKEVTIQPAKSSKPLRPASALYKTLVKGLEGYYSGLPYTVK